MPNYNTQVPLPDYRNLVINPGGEQTYSATWVANNGSVTSSTTMHKSGTGSMRYTVTNTSANVYSFGPMGPESNAHVGRFKISDGGQASGKIYVKAPQDVWVQLRFIWYSKTWPNGTSQAPVLKETGDRTVVVDTLKITGGASSWTQLSGRVIATSVPKGATHFQMMVVVFGSGGANPAAPAKNTLVYADEAFVPDNGTNVDAVATVIGGQGGARWEGEPNHSTSTTVPAPVTPPPTGEPDPDDPDPGDPEDPDPDAPDPPDGDDGQSPDNPEDPEPPGDQAPVPPQSNNPNGLPPWGGGSDGQAVVEDFPADGGIKNPQAIVLAERASTYRYGNQHFKLNRDVQVSNLILNSVDTNGITWIVTDIDGWWTIPEPDVPDQPRSWFDGSFETRGRYPARTFTLNGVFIPNSPNQLAQARDRLIRAVNLVHKGGWFMTHEDPLKFTNTKGSRVWMVGQPLIATNSLSGKTDFSIMFRAPDPMKYSIKDGIPPGWNMLRLKTSAAEYPKRPYPREYPWAYPEAVFGTTDSVATNSGNAVVFPILRMRGPTIGAVRVINSTTRQTLRITKALEVGEELVVDCATKQVTMNGGGNFRFYLDLDVDWLMLQPGENQLTFKNEELGGETELEVLWRSAWIG